MKQPISVLKNFFSAFKMPTGSNFGDMIDSFFHKDGKIPAANIEGWTDDSAVILEPGVLELPTLGDKNKSVKVLGGAAGKIYTYKGAQLPILANNEGILFWDATPELWKIQDQAPLPSIDTSNLLAKSEIKSTSVNLLDKTTMLLPDKIINSDGLLQTVIGGVVAKIDISNLHKPNEDLLISWRGKLGANGPYYAFYEGATMKSYAAYNNTLPKTVTAPTTSNILYVTIRSAIDPPTVYDTFMINLGATALAYQPYEGFLTAVDGKKIPPGGGESYDQPLNKADRVDFKEVTTEVVNTETLITDEVIINGTPKVGTKINPPSGLIKGDPWLDTTDSTTDPIVRYRNV